MNGGEPTNLPDMCTGAKRPKCNSGRPAETTGSMTTTMGGFTYSKEEVQCHLEALPDGSRIAFGLSCCERLFRNYAAFKREVKWGNEQPLREALDELWQHLEGQTMDELRAKQLLSACEAAAPDSENFSSPLTGPAQEACLSVCCVLDYLLDGNVERIAQTSLFARDTLDSYVQELIDRFSTVPTIVPTTQEREEQIRSHPLMQRGLARQEADLRLLMTSPGVGTLKAQWCAPGKSNIGL